MSNNRVNNRNPKQPTTPASPYQPTKSTNKGKAPEGGVTKPAVSGKSKNKDNITDAMKHTPSKAVQTRSPGFALRKMDAIEYYTQPTTDEDTRKDLAVYLGIRYMPYIESFSKRMAQAEKELNTVIAQNKQIAQEAAPDQNDEAHQALRAQLFENDSQDIELSEDDSQDIELSEDASQDIQMGEDHGPQIEQDSDEIMHEQHEAGDDDAGMSEDEVNNAPENFEQQGAHQEGAADAATQIKQLTENLNTLIRERDQARTELEKARTTIEKEESRYNYQLGMQDGKEESINEINILKNKLKTAANSVEAEAKRVADSIAGIRQELNQSKADLNTANTQINSLKKDLENSKTKIEDLNTKLSKATPEEQKGIQAKLDQAEAELENTKLAADSLESELSEALVNLKKNQTEKTNLEVKLNRTKGKLNDFKFKFTRAEVRFEKARKHWENIAKGLEAETIGAKDELAEAQASWEEAKFNYEQAQESYAIDLKDLENQLRKTKFELATKVPMAIKAGGQRGLEIGEKRGIKRGRAEGDIKLKDAAQKQKEELESATKKRRITATALGTVAGGGLGLLAAPSAQALIAILRPTATATVHNAMMLAPYATTITGAVIAGHLARKLYQYSIRDLTNK